MNNREHTEIYPARRWILIIAFMAMTTCLLWRVVDLQLLNNEFLQNHGDARSIRVVSIPAHRGSVVDRNDEPLAISTPVESVWAEPAKVVWDQEDLSAIASILETDPVQLRQFIQDRIGRNFVYIKRLVTPDQANAIRKISIEGVHLQSEYRRYYPAGEVTAHLVGFTNVDDVGQEGLELAYNDWLSETAGSKRVLQDNLRRIIGDIESIKSADPGNKLVLSIDRRVQYLAYRELKKAVARHKARGGSLVMLDSKTGEVMAMVGQPSYNPNNRSDLKSDEYRNRAITDVFEPGSTMKPFTITAALMSDMYTPKTLIDTSPGFLKINNHTISDINNYGVIDVTNIIRKSSNIGASKIALSLGPERMWEIFSLVGFGQQTDSGFPGESAGIFSSYHNWSEAELATISFGYGISVTMMQLAQAYSVLATGGLKRPISFLKVEEEVPAVRVLPAKIVEQIMIMIEAVVQKDGGGRRAAVTGYRIAGKTGTAHKAEGGGYAENRHMSLFAGIAPVSEPRLVAVVMIDEPQGDEHYGGQVAAPVFSNVVKGALRILNIPPDDLQSMDNQVIMVHNSVTNGSGIEQ